jgi:hypothetical protein
MIRSATVINFKKVVSMAVVLSLMLGACGKNPARRDGGTATDTATDLRALEEKNRELNKQDELEEWVSPKGIGAGLAGGVVGGILGMEAVLIILNIIAARNSNRADNLTKDMARGARAGALAGAVVGGISGGIFGKMSDGWVKLMLKTGFIGLGAVGGSSVTFILAAFIKGEIGKNN